MRFIKKMAWIFFTLLLFSLAAGFYIAGEAGSRPGQASESQKKVRKIISKPETSESKPAVAHDTLPEKAILSAPFISQKPELPNGCEVSSLTMLLNSAGIPANKMQLAEKVKKVPFSSGTYQGNPNTGFVGNMYHGDTNHPGLAVYHGPIADLARQYLEGRVRDLSGNGWEQVERSIAAGSPVWVIVSIDFQPVPEDGWRTWHTRQGDIRVSFMEHSVLLTGYDEHYVYFNDPQKERGGSKAEKSAFIEAWKQFGNQAVTYSASGSESEK